MYVTKDSNEHPLSAALAPGVSGRGDEATVASATVDGPQAPADPAGALLTRSGPVSTQLVSLKARPRFQPLSTEELDQLPPPEWLVGDMFPTSSLGVLYGPPNEGKTWVALDFAMSIAAGSDVHGRTVLQGAVVYVLGEGLSGFSMRVKAWIRHHRTTGLPFFIVREPVQFANAGEVEELRRELHGLAVPVRLIVVDTLARAIVGVEENSAKEMGVVIDAARRLQDEFGCSLWFVHHSGRPRPFERLTERGSTSLRGAADTMASVTMDAGGIITLACQKQKDAEYFPEMRFRLEKVTLDKAGQQFHSCVLLSEERMSSSECPLPPHLHDALLGLAECSPSPVPVQVWREASNRRRNVKVRTFDAHRAEIEELGLVRRTQKGVYELTELGSATALELQPHVPSGDSPTAATAPPLVGGAGLQERDDEAAA